MDIFEFRDRLIESYKSFSRSFTKIESEDIREKVNEELKAYWPEPLIQINPCYQTDRTVQEFCDHHVLHPECGAIFRDKHGKSLRLYLHQAQAIEFARKKESYIVTTGTGSGKSLAFFIPIINRILEEKATDPKPRTRAIILYPMNALANSQKEEIEKFLTNPGHPTPLTVARYTGQETEAEREVLRTNPPDILLTNYMMLELVLMRSPDRPIVQNCEGLEFLVLDELHTYRGRQGADVALLVRRLRSQLKADHLICIGTSATMSSAPERSEQNRAVSEVASKIFGTRIDANHVVNETLQGVTDAVEVDKISQADLHREVVSAASAHLKPLDFEGFKKNPLAEWLERKLSITDRFTRAMPQSVTTIVEHLSEAAGTDPETTEKALKHFLSQFGTENSIRTPEGRNPFPFKLHQFISGPGKVYVTLGEPGKRTITLDGQTSVADPENSNKRIPLFEAYFCRDCGQEYIPVWITRTNEGAVVNVKPRSMDEMRAGDSTSYGYICPVTEGQLFTGEITDLPDEWLDPKNSERVKTSRRKDIPQRLTLSPEGFSSGIGTDFWLLTGKFKICVNCLHTYSANGRDKHRLTGLSGEGRSSATTIISLQILRQLYDMPLSDDKHKAFRKLLGFSDNRQDTALQAGHFNDFVSQLILRSGLIRALENETEPKRLPEIVDAICTVFRFNDEKDEAAKREYLLKPDTTTGQLLTKALSALRFSLSFQLLNELQDRGLYTSPSLERLHLLSVSYEGLENFCRDGANFGSNGALLELGPQKRFTLVKRFLDEVRHRLCISSIYFDPKEQDTARAREYGLLTPRWSFSSLSPESHHQTVGTAFVLNTNDRKAWSFGGTVKFTEKSGIIPTLGKLDIWDGIKDDTGAVIRSNRQAMHELLVDMTKALCQGGYLKPTQTKEGTYYQLVDSCVLWSKSKEPTDEKFNSYYRTLYLDVADTMATDGQALFDFEAEEHTAQVSAEERQDLEIRFRGGPEDEKKWNELHAGVPYKRLPVLYCSPTMELGIDISALNYVYMRNIPPTAANYVQRAGRAGRSGDQALSISYCSAMSPHDQWFFHKPEQMVQGVVKPPTMDLGNEALVRSHMHSIWMSAACIDLPITVSQVLDLAKPEDGYPVKEEIMESLTAPRVTEDAIVFGNAVASQLSLSEQSWYTDTYVESVMKSAPREFEASFDNWRALYRATLEQIRLVNETLGRYGITAEERDSAKSRWQDAQKQRELLESASLTSTNNDFYTYRYLASQAFLPGYNFPAMPLLAWIPDPSGSRNDSTVISRSRFLGLAEFGPRNVIYHRGRIYRVDRLKISVQAGGATASDNLATDSVIVCPHCGYAHVMNGTVYNECENCGNELHQENIIQGLYRVTMVETTEIQRITTIDENRQNQGFDMQTLYRFGDTKPERTEVMEGKKPLATISYAPAASIWRVNLGWKYRLNQKTKGFVINPLTGYWRNEGPDAEEKENKKEDKAQKNAKSQVIVPYVTDTRNILLFEPNVDLGEGEDRQVFMATLQAALKRAIEQYFEIESNEISIEPLPGNQDRKSLLIYETGEGGAGILREISKDPKTYLRALAREALSLMHYEFKNVKRLKVEDLVDTKESCADGCYSCLLTYFNQPEHELIHRRDPKVLEFLVGLANTEGTAAAPETVKLFPTSSDKNGESNTPMGHFQVWAVEYGYRVPDKIPKTFKALGLKFDGAYTDALCCVSFTPVSDDARESLADFGWDVLDLSNEDSWGTVMSTRPDLKSSN